MRSISITFNRRQILVDGHAVGSITHRRRGWHEAHVRLGRNGKHCGIEVISATSRPKLRAKVESFLRAVMNN